MTKNISQVSIPFIAGQWSLLFTKESTQLINSPSFNPLHCGAVVASKGGASVERKRPDEFQSPSLRGSGRF